MALSQESFIKDKEDVDAGKKKKKKKSSEKTKSVATGAAAGATAGAVAGPFGALIGAGVGAGISLAESNAAEKSTGPRPERRRLATAEGIRQERKRKRQLALATLSQAAVGAASRIR